MVRRQLIVLILFLATGYLFGQPQGPDSAVCKPDTIFVIPAGPEAGTFTSHARVTIEDTVAGWARIRVEGWVPVEHVLDRFDDVYPAGQSTLQPGLRSGEKTTSAPQCAGTTRKGERCSRRAAPGSRFCWQHQNQDSTHSKVR